jgi:hypothetical protein
MQTNAIRDISELMIRKTAVRAHARFGISYTAVLQFIFFSYPSSFSVFEDFNETT